VLDTDRRELRRRTQHMAAGQEISQLPMQSFCTQRLRGLKVTVGHAIEQGAHQERRATLGRGADLLGARVVGLLLARGSNPVSNLSDEVGLTGPCRSVVAAYGLHAHRLRGRHTSKLRSDRAPARRAAIRSPRGYLAL